MTGRHPPEYVITLWMCDELRERHPELPLSLSEALALSEVEPSEALPLPEALPEAEI
jgi:hypothetical protein